MKNIHPWPIAVSIFVDMLVELTNTVFVNSTTTPPHTQSFISPSVFVDRLSSISVCLCHLFVCDRLKFGKVCTKIIGRRSGPCQGWLVGGSRVGTGISPDVAS